MADYSLAIPSQEESDPFPAGDGNQFDLKGRLGLSKMRTRMWYFEPGEASSYHRHGEQEELYYLVDGPGQIRVGHGDDEEVVDVEDGTAVKVAPETPRQLLNETDSTTQWLVVAAPDVVEGEIYHDERGEFLPLSEFM